jgi:hypothetical protein
VRTIRNLVTGFAHAVRHPRLVALLWAVPFLPALAVALLASSVLEPLDRRPFTTEIVEGRWFGPWTDFRESPLDQLDPVLGMGVLLALTVGLVAQVVVAAGLVEVLLQRRHDRPFLTGIRRNGWRFARSAGWFLVGLALAAVSAAMVGRGLFDLAASRANGWLDVVGVGAATGVFVLLAAPLLMAYDQSRIAAAAYGEGSMFLGLVRGLAFVLRHPVRFAVLAVLTALLPVIVHLAYGWVRAPWVPSSGIQVTLLLVIQQAVMIVRAYFKLGLWATHVTMWRDLGSPRLARRRRRRERTTVGVSPPVAVEPEPDPAS